MHSVMKSPEHEDFISPMLSCETEAEALESNLSNDNYSAEMIGLVVARSSESDDSSDSERVRRSPQTTARRRTSADKLSDSFIVVCLRYR